MNAPPNDFDIGIIEAKIAEADRWRAEWRETKQRAKAYYLGYSSVEQMEDHLPWLETRFPEGAEL